MSAPRHGAPRPADLTVEEWLNDPSIAAVGDDLWVWLDAHPCDCHADCECEDS